METPGTYLNDQVELTPEQIAVYQQWMQSALTSWREKFRPAPLELLSMAVALERLAGILQSEVATKFHAQTPRS